MMMEGEKHDFLYKLRFLKALKMNCIWTEIKNNMKLKQIGAELRKKRAMRLSRDCSANRTTDANILGRAWLVTFD